MPPIHCVNALQNKSDRGNISTFCMIDAPVVVRPDADSKKASVKERIPESEYGSAATIVNIHQIQLTSNTPSFAVRARRCLD